MPSKEEQGKVLICEYTTDASGASIKSDAEYLTWPDRPESLKMQFDMVDKYIYSFSNTPDIIFTNILQNSPGNISGVALRMLMMDAIIKSYNKQEIFEENLSRELSVVKSILSKMEVKYAKSFAEMEIEIVFNSILPNNITEVINYLTAATGGMAVMSQETAIKNNPLIKNKEVELAKVKEESAIESGSFNLE